MLVGWHYLPGNLTDGLAPLGACTVLDLEVRQARSSEQLVRPYFTGRPDPAVLAGRLAEPPCFGQRCQLANEPNHPEEGFGGGPGDYAAWFLAVAERAPVGARLYYAPPSPGFTGWRSYYTHPHCRTAINHAFGLSVHAYGSRAQMLDVVRFVASEHPTKPLWLSEVNPGAGQSFDLNAWAESEFRPFLDECARTVPTLEAVTFFAYQWDRSPSLPSSVDGRHTAVERVLHSWATPPPQPKPPEEPMPEDWYPPAARKPIVRNYTPGRAGPGVYGIVDHIADGNGGLQGWFNDPAAKASAHFWVSKTGAVEQYRPLSDTCWANGRVSNPDRANPTVNRIVVSGVDPNAVTVAIEHEGVPGQAFPPAMVDASAALHAWLGGRFGIALTRDAVIGHYQLDAVTRPNCPGPTFPYEEVLSVAQSPEVIALQDALFSLAEQIQRLQPRWEAAGELQMGSYCGQQGEAIKRVVALQKGER